ncbi:hypothetical protein [Arthrobacter alpinus]|nr:hypothetical protein [Arthrobacter alpinus]
MNDSQEVLPIWSTQPVPPVWAPNDPATASWTNTRHLLFRPSGRA